MAATEANGTPLAGNINVALGRNDLPTATLLHPASGASCEVILTGAHVTSWKTADGVERLFVSSASKFGDGAAIRGGIPVCWPQFSGRGSLPKHGFVRTSSEWEIAEMVSDEGATKLVLYLKDSEATRAVWPHAFELRYAITLTGEALSTAMELTNTGAEPLTFASALHTYFAVPDVTTVKVLGLGGLKYEDNTAGGSVAIEEAEEVAIAGEVDRVYLEAPEVVQLAMPGYAELTLRKTAAFPDLVMWNLGKAKAPTMADLGEGEWQHYLCLEAGAVSKPVSLEPGATWSAAQTFQITPQCTPIE